MKRTRGQDTQCPICGSKVAWIKRPFPKLSHWEVCPAHAAAPDLLVALQLLHDNLAEYQRINNIGGYDNADMTQARAAIALAMGDRPMTDTFNPDFRGSKIAFENAIKRRVLSDNASNPCYVGKYMYMFTDPARGDAFKHVDTRHYIYVEVEN